MIAGRWSPTTPAIRPRPMPILLVAAVLEAAIAAPSRRPRERGMESWGPLLSALGPLPMTFAVDAKGSPPCWWGVWGWG